MEMMAFMFLCVGYILVFLGALWVIVLAWQKGILWGLGCLLFPVIQLIYIALNWKQAKSAFFLQLAGLGAFLLAAVIGR
jgi:hypothetical protein